MEEVSKLLDLIWPFPGYRRLDGSTVMIESEEETDSAAQKSVMLDAIEALFEDGKDCFTVSAPTGFGKSPVCYTLGYAVGLLQRVSAEDRPLAEAAEKAFSRVSEKSSSELAYYVTPQNILLDQLDEDFGGMDTFGMVKGRSHYPCPESAGSCSDGPCRFDDDMDCSSYAAARDEALESAVTNTNFSMFMVHPKITQRECLVVDECHMMPEYVLGQVEVDLREDRLEDDWELPEYDEFEEYVDWMRPKVHELARKLEELNMVLQQQSQRGSPERELVIKYDRLERLKSKMDRLVADWASEEEPWVVQHDTIWDDRKNAEVEKVNFRPITPYRFMDGLVFDKGQKVILSSATPPEPEILGLEPENVLMKEVESPFPVENRPCYIDTVGKLSKSNRKENIDKLIGMIHKVSAGNTIIHAHTYGFAEEIADRLGAIEGDGNVMLQSADDREGSLRAWENSDAQFFVSVNMYDGVDLEGDLARTNIVCVCPFPYLGDPQVQKRKEVEGDKFFNWRTAMRIQQAYGRTTRNPEDWSNTYIVDSNFHWFYDYNQDLFFDWFKEGVEGV